MAWTLEQGPRIRTAVGEGRHVWVVPLVDGFAVSRLTMGGVSTLFASPYAVDDWLDELQLNRLDDILTRAAQHALDLVVELDGLNCFDLGTKWRPDLERAFRTNGEQQLSEALVSFEALADGTPVQALPRQLSQKVTAGHIAIAECVAALTHGRWMGGIEELMNLQSAVLTQEIAAASKLAK